MGAKRFIAIVLLLFLSALSMVLLVFKLHSAAFYLEFLLMCIFAITSLVVLFGIYFDEMWTWQLSTLLFTVMIANFILFRYYSTNNTVSWAGIASSLAGFLVSAASIKSYDDHASEIEEPAQPEKTAEKKPVKKKRKAK